MGRKTDFQRTMDSSSTIEHWVSILRERKKESFPSFHVDGNDDVELLLSVLEREVERLGKAQREWSGYTFEQVHASDPRWKGWGVRGNARFHNGWIIFKDGEEVYRYQPESDELSFDMIVNSFDLHLQVAALKDKPTTD